MGEKPTKIIFVCHGNICRSPMAEFIFKHLAESQGCGEDFEISSAAVSYEEEGNGLYHYAADTLRRHGVPFGRHRAHRITVQEFDEADIVVVMDSSNLRLLDRITGGPHPGKVRKLMEFCEDSRSGSLTAADVADPWYTGNFEQAFSDILQGCRALLRHFD
ncbi:MAG: low molecular weight protein-tyrosine-phosphatase [Candidatus Cryptobacteroides sp.]